MNFMGSLKKPSIRLHMQNISYDDLIYLVIGVFYLLIRYTKRRNPAQQTMPSAPYAPMPQTIAHTDDPHPHNKQAKESVSARSSPPLLVRTTSHATRSITLQPAGSCTARQKMAYMLRRHGSLKKAVIMHEIIRVYDS